MQDEEELEHVDAMCRLRSVRTHARGTTRTIVQVCLELSGLPSHRAQPQGGRAAVRLLIRFGSAPPTRAVHRFSDELGYCGRADRSSAPALQPPPGP
jgi:hypothetical protein